MHNASPTIESEERDDRPVDVNHLDPLGGDRLHIEQG